MLVQQRCGRITVLLPFFFFLRQRAEPDLVARTRVLWESELFGFLPITVAHEALNAGPAQSFFPALTSMPKSDDGRAALQMLQLGGFIAPEAQSFDQIAARTRIVADRG